MDLTKNYDFKEAEPRIQKFWEKEKIYAFDPKNKKPCYSVDTPPPTVSGRMHIGHALSYSQQDFAIRFRRMKEGNVFYPFGTDDNGLPTERLVEKTKGIKAKEMQRHEFIKLCLAFLEEERPKFIQDWKDIGISADFNICYSTIDDHSRKISQWSFLDLFKKKRVYRKDAPSMWCPECRTGVAQVEVQDKEIDSTFNNIVFKIDNQDLVIATTRPEMLPACVAVFYNPSDERYKKLKGKKAKVPLFNFEVPIMEDEKADPEKGTGIVMCCTFGDQTDMEWQKAHNLEIKIAITGDGKMNELAGRYKDLTIKSARKIIIQDLKEANLLRSQKPIKHMVNVHERCGTEIEFIKSKQWFVKYLDLKKEMLQWGSELNWYPDHMKHRYINWVNGLQWDWLISNQRYFGVSFPVWYCKKCGEPKLAEESQLPVDPQKDKPKGTCEKCKSKDFIPETDVLNTWFTSSMTPQLAVQLMPKETQKKIFPMSLRPQAHDIITFWLFNTVLKSNLHYGKNPWKDVAISGFVTLQGEKMSKSKGNTIEPRAVLNNYGADALRYWASSSKLGEDLGYQEKDLITGKKFVTKIWNASKLILTHIENFDGKKPNKLEPIDAYILSKLNTLSKNSIEYFESYEYSKAKAEIDNFFWNTFCDYYLEIIKDRLYNPDKRGKEAKSSAQYTLNQSLLTILKLFAPFTPYIAEEIYQMYYAKQEKKISIHISDWPEYNKQLSNEKLEKDSEAFINLIAQVRQFKSKNGKSLKEPVKIEIPIELEKTITPFLEDLKATTNALEIKFEKSLKETKISF